MFLLLNNFNQIAEFNKRRYKDHKAFISESNFLEDKVYLYKIYSQIIKLNIKNTAQTKILDIGCADGSFANFLAHKGFNVYGIDISEEAIKKASVFGIKASQCDIEQGLKFKDNYFDIIIASEIIEHLYDTDYFLEEIKRVTKKYGYLFISTPNLASLKNRVRLLFGRYPQYTEYRIGRNLAGHIRNYTPQVLKKQLKDNRWNVIKTTSPNILCPMTKDIPIFIKKIAIFFGDIFYSLGSHIIIIARK